MQKIEAVKTSDGRLFETNEEAAKHEIEVAVPARIDELWNEYIAQRDRPHLHNVKEFVLTAAEDLNRVTATVKRAKQVLEPSRQQFEAKRQGHTYCKHCDSAIASHEKIEGKWYCRKENL
jgi:predicted 2-oxoglutarate/Fe(II)-dependent dioxygenase YbiX